MPKEERWASTKIISRSSSSEKVDNVMRNTSFRFWIVVGISQRLLLDAHSMVRREEGKGRQLHPSDEEIEHVNSDEIVGPTPIKLF